ncbi:MAG: hypothetical protein R8G66_18965 [Cytophagales bacterium]|nr:hypothetical protein [Cytophagales bacterium]
MTPDEFVEIIQYNEEWFLLGFLPQGVIQQQMEEWSISNDRNIEHYKWGAYRYILDNEDFKNKDRLLAFVQLMESDPNEHLYKGAIHSLIEIHGVYPKTLAEFGGERISNNPVILKML